MTEAEIAHERRRLLSMKRRLGRDLSALADGALRPLGGEASGNLSDVLTHLMDLAPENETEEIALDLRENEERLPAEVAGALARIERGRYGRCEDCGREIPGGTT